MNLEADCLFGKRMSWSEPTEFDLAYIGAQVDASFDEIGDAFDESTATLLAVAEQAGSNHFEEQKRAGEIVTCLQRRYLGHCAASKCEMRTTVDEVIETVVSVATVQ